MRRSLVAIVAFCVSVTAPAFAVAPLPAPSGFDQPPLLVVHWVTDTIAAEIIDTSVVIHVGGATEITEMRKGQPARILRGVATAADFRALADALTAGQVASERGGCGNPTADGPIAYDVTWYGQGARFNTFTVGADLTACATGLRAMVERMAELIDHVRPAPDTQSFPRARR